MITMTHFARAFSVTDDIAAIYRQDNVKPVIQHFTDQYFDTNDFLLAKKKMFLRCRSSIRDGVRSNVRTLSTAREYLPTGFQYEIVSGDAIDSLLPNEPLKSFVTIETVRIIFECVRFDCACFVSVDEEPFVYELGTIACDDKTGKLGVLTESKVMFFIHNHLPKLYDSLPDECTMFTRALNDNDGRTHALFEREYFSNDDDWHEYAFNFSAAARALVFGRQDDDCPTNDVDE